MASSCQQLRDKIMDESIEWPPGENLYFIPFSTIKNLVGQDSTLVIDTLKDGLYKRSGRTIGDYIKVSILGHLLDEGISDDNLPFSRIHVHSLSATTNNKYRLGKADHHLCTEADHGACDIAAFSRLSNQRVKEICGRQWSALAPVFGGNSNGIIHYDFERGTILPYVEDWEGKKFKAGGYGEVWRIRIHPAHQNFFESKDPKGPLLAIKRLNPMEDYDKIFDLEVDMLKALNAYQHKHIVRLLATYKFKERYHLLFPLASGNLKDHWRTISMPFWNQVTYHWVLTQLKGLISALDIIHNIETGLQSVEPDIPNAGTSHRPSFRGIKLRIEEREAKFGRHGDIKPENILWMKDFVHDPGSFVIADMGLGRFHRKESRSLVDPKKINGSPTYAPPEVSLNRPVSRAYDIWSLGCVFTEFITWLFRGSSGLVLFGNNRMEVAEDGIEDDTFYSIRTSSSGQVAVLRSGVSSWVRDLKGHNRCSGAFNEILRLIEEKMLLVDPKSRITAKDLKSTLKSMLIKATNDKTYLLGVHYLAEDATQGFKMPT